MKQRMRNVWLSTPTPQFAEILAKSGFDSVTVDLQHGLGDYASAVDCFRAIALHGAAPWVRVPWNEPGPIMRMLDSGALGIICPMVSNPEQAEAFVGACRYPFDGGYRSFGPVRAATMIDDYVTRSRALVTALAMIETREGFEKVEAIAQVEGLDGFYIGPADLSLAFDMAPGQDKTDAAFLDLIDHVRETAHKHGKVCGIHAATPAYGRSMLDRGFDLVTATSDVSLVSGGARDAIATLG